MFEPSSLLVEKMSLSAPVSKYFKKIIQILLQCCTSYNILSQKKLQWMDWVNIDHFKIKKCMKKFNQRLPSLSKDLHAA